ncbi:hypothetical protein HYT57_05210 [Candidatus Woesearchaeota archaeon]|nr:hypothetical protein [Candidatus Woesearchaeota archaeon]
MTDLVVTDEFEILVDQRLEALAGGNAVKYAELCDETGVIEDESLYQLGHAELIFQRRKQELLIAEERIPLGIRQKDLSLLSYPTLESVFYGIHNIEIPNEMLNTLNPDEAIAKYCAAGLLKRGNRHLSSEIPRRFLDLVSALDREAYSRMDICDMRKQSKKRFPDTSGEQRKRLLTLDFNVRSQFVNSFFAGYRPSNREESNNPCAFYDPNIDGRSKSVYARDIARILNGK